MMHLMESCFDLAYLGLVIGLGLRLLLEKSKPAKSFGLMAIILGVGDAFHLLPRVLSQLTPDGFAKYEAARSWGLLVTSITMTIFFYFVTGLSWTVTAFMVRGIYTICAQGVALFPDGALSGLAGIGHVLLGIGIVWLSLKALKENLPAEA